MKNNLKIPPKWTAVYPQGSKKGDEEQGLFIALERHPKYQWRSVAALAKESNLSAERVEEILNKYYKKGMVFQSPDNADHWAYWERVPHMLPLIEKSITSKDHSDRIQKLKSS